jgi:hypothetical protein
MWLEIAILAGSVALAAALPLAYSTGGLRRLWRITACIAASLVLVALAWPNLEYYNHGPLVAAGVSTISWPLVPLVIAALVPLAVRLPGGAPTASILLIPVAYLGATSISWIA